MPPTRSRTAASHHPSIPARIALGLAVALAPAGGGGFAQEGDATPEFSREPYVQLATEGSIHIVWRTERDITPRVAFGVSPDQLDRWAEGDAITLRRPAAEPPKKAHDDPTQPAPLHSAPPETRQYEAFLSGLGSNVTYYYAIYDGDTRLTPEDPSYRFKTHPPIGSRDEEILAWVVGDSGTGGQRQIEVHDALVEHLEETGQSLDLYLHVGDMAYNDGKDEEFSRNFFTPYAATLRHTVCWASMGNHEGHTSRGEFGIGPYYDAYVCPTRGEAGGVPSGTEAYYSFDCGNVHFIVLDSHDLDRRPTGAMAEWLQADLEKTTADWLVAYWHHPPYTKGSHDSDKEEQLIEMRELIMPILEAGGIDVVLTGHSHIYERSMLIDGAYATPTTADNVVLDDGDGDPDGDGAYRKSEGIHPNEGVIQVVAGHGGQNLGRVGTSPIMKRVVVQHGSVLLRVKGTTLSGSMLNHMGGIRDVFSIVKEGKVTPTRLTKPEKPAPLPEPEDDQKEKTAKEARDFKSLQASAIIGPDAKWKYLAGSDPAADWTSPAFDDGGWLSDQPGFGYGDGDDRTRLSMKGRYSRVYLRNRFTLPGNGTDGRPIGRILIGARFDDAFIAYINGREVLRVGVASGSGAGARDIAAHEAGDAFAVFPLSDLAMKDLGPGEHVIAIEAHNSTIDSSDFTIHPIVLQEEK